MRCFTYRVAEQRRLRRVYAYAQTRQSLVARICARQSLIARICADSPEPCCLHVQSLDVDEDCDHQHRWICHHGRFMDVVAHMR